MKVRDLCICDVAAATRRTSLARAGMLMRKYEVGSLPVVDRHDRVIGMLTDRDCFLEIARRNAPASELFAEEIMTERPASVSAKDDVRDALDLMARYKVRRLPVVDEEGRLEGILSIDDLICHSVEEGRGRTIPYEDVVETLCEIVKEYAAESGELRSSPHAARREAAMESSSRRRRYYRKEEPEFEAEEGRTPSRSRLGRAKSER
ncbi:MAG: CBS domain-containing protein [Planctomycetes bacterium]|nr:CBS domain-containing protein [Planctomycetota bacterium]